MNEIRNEKMSVERWKKAVEAETDENTVTDDDNTQTGAGGGGNNNPPSGELEG